MKSIKAVTAAVLMTFATTGMASTIGSVILDPAATEVLEGEMLSIDVFMDVTGAPGNSPGSIRGDLLITWDSSLVSFDSFTFLEANESFAPVESDGELTISFNLAEDVSTIGSLEFTVLASEGSTLNFGIENQFGFSTFANVDPTVAGFEPALVGTEVTVVPLPAAAWFMLSGLGMLAGFARRQSV